MARTLLKNGFIVDGSGKPGFTGDLGGDVGLSCNITSLTILISIITIVTLLLCLL